MIYDAQCKKCKLFNNDECIAYTEKPEENCKGFADEKEARKRLKAMLNYSKAENPVPAIIKEFKKIIDR